MFAKRACFKIRGLAWRRINTTPEQEIAKLHEAAITANQKFYIDPASGYRVFTRDVHIKRGKCCGSVCRHCPYDHENVKMYPRKGTTTSAINKINILKREITFVTGNAKKLQEVSEILGAGDSTFPFRFVSRKIDLPELQGSPEEVSREKCKAAAAQVGGPVIVEDTSLCFNALGGLPGVYIKVIHYICDCFFRLLIKCIQYFLETIGHKGLNNLLVAYEDKTAYAQCIFAYSPEPGSDPVLFVGQCHGEIVQARGPPNFG